jgi:hypothetical protein
MFHIIYLQIYVETWVCFFRYDARRLVSGIMFHIVYLQIYPERPGYVSSVMILDKGPD